MAYRSSTSTSTSGTTNLTATAPAGVTAGDRLLAMITQDVNNSTAHTTATGWVEIGAEVNTGTPDNQTFSLHEKKVATGSDSYDFTSVSATRAIIQVVCLSGRHATNEVVQASTLDITSNTTPISMSITGVTALEGDDIILFTQLNQTAAGDTWGTDSPTNYTERHDVANSDWITAATNTRDAVSAGATGALTMTATRLTGAGNAGYGGWVVSVPAGAGGGGGPALQESGWYPVEQQTNPMTVSVW